MAALDLRGAVVAGWSMGGQVALESAPALRERLAALALLSTTPRFCQGEGWPHGLPPSHVRALAVRLARDARGALEHFFDGLFVPGELDASPALAALRARALGEPPCSSAVARAGLAALLEADQRPRLAQLCELGLPVVFIHGERDPISPAGASEEVVRALRGARRHVLPGCGHAPHLSRPAEVNGWLRALLANPGDPA